MSVYYFDINEKRQFYCYYETIEKEHIFKDFEKTFLKCCKTGGTLIVLNPEAFKYFLKTALNCKAYDELINIYNDGNNDIFFNMEIMVGKASVRYNNKTGFNNLRPAVHLIGELCEL